VSTIPDSVFLRPLSALVLVTLLSACASAPKERTPIWPWAGHTQQRMTAKLAQAADAWDTLKNLAVPATRRQQAEVTYERALADVLRDWDRRQPPKTWQIRSTFADKNRSYTLDLQPAPGHPLEVSPLMLDRLRLADEVRVARKLTLAQEDGLGVPVIGQVTRSPELAAKHPLMPLNGGHLTLTALLEFDPVPKDVTTARRARLHLYNPLRQPDAVIAGKKTRLAANYTAPKELALNDGFLNRFSLTGLLFPEKVLADSHLYRLELYDPQRIPVVFVHGLMSDPHIWFQCINSLYADPVLRARYQPWYFLYPSGLAVPATSRRLRESLAEARDRLDPDHNDPGMARMVLVGHSMGGLLSRMQTISSRNDFWSAYFKCPPEQLNLSADSRDRLVQTLRFEPQPFVKRLIFITVPHRGSEVADKGIVQRLATLIRLPLDSVLLAKELLSGNTDALSPQIRDWGAYAFLSLSTLSPKHPYLHALNTQPIPVPHHSIIGRVGKDPLERSSDRVVPYTSAHLPTGTEVIVPHWHGCVEQPAVVAEVLKRLHEHLRH